MKTLIGVVTLLSLLSVSIGCSHRVTRTTTSRESVSVPADPVVTERRTTTRTETHTNY